MLNGEPTNTNFKVLILSDLGSNSHQDLAHSRLARYQCLTENQQIPILKFCFIQSGLELTPRSSTLKASTLSMLNGEPTNTNFKVLILSDLGSNSHQDLAHSRLARYQCSTENQQIPILKF